MTLDINAADIPRGTAVLLHPHPDFGGNRLHPFIEALFIRLPRAGVNAIRFDFPSSDVGAAREDAIAAIDGGTDRWPQLPVVLAGYSFGAAIAATIDTQQVAGGYLLAPPGAALLDAAIGRDPRPKVIVVPEHDQFSPPEAVASAVVGWEATTVTIVPNADHFLVGAIEPIVEPALGWIGRLTR